MVQEHFIFQPPTERAAGLGNEDGSECQPETVRSFDGVEIGCLHGLCMACNEADEFTGIESEPGDCRANTASMIFRNTPLARQIVKWWGSPTRCEEEAERWRERGMTEPMVDMMRYWCPRDNDQDAFNRLLVTMKHKHFGTTGGIRVVGARYLNRPMFPTNPECLEDGTICHMSPGGQASSVVVCGKLP